MSGIIDDIKNAYRSGNSLYQVMILNGLVFLILTVLSVVLKLTNNHGLYNAISIQLFLPASVPDFLTKPWTLLTYGFTHEGFFHIAFNLLVLYAFGNILVEFINSRRFLAIYLWGVIGGGVFYILIYNLAPYFANTINKAVLLGASAGVYAVVVATATLAPNYTFFLIFLGPVRIKYIALFYIVLSFFETTGHNAGGNLAHLGGALLGFLFIKLLKNGTDLGTPVYKISDFINNLKKPKSKMKVTYASYKQTEYKKTDYKSSDAINQAEIDRILDKIAESGYDKLTTEEKQKLFKASQQ
jgi:membrane associated rhomboid family serine protease